METPPWLIILAGPNGAGKSTFYNKVLQEDPLFHDIPFVNLDNYAKKLATEKGGTPEEYFFQAGQLTRRDLDNRLHNRENFIYETTSAGKTHLTLMNKAKALGYQVGVVFIGLANAELSHLRVKSRVQNGGHDVPSEVIEQRYPKIIKRFPEMLKRCDVAAVFDNSSNNPYKLIFYMNEKTIYTGDEYPTWVEQGLEGRKTSKTFHSISPEIIKQLKEEQKALAIQILSKKGRNS